MGPRPALAPSGFVERPDKRFEQNPLLALGIALVVFLLSFGIPAFVYSRYRKGSAARTTAAPYISIRRVSIAFDWTARPALQQALTAAAERFDMSSIEGLHRAANAVVTLLHKNLDAARYAMWQSFSETPQSADERLNRTIMDIKSRYRHDVTAGAQIDIKSRAEEGQGLVVVSLIVGGERLLDLPRSFTPVALSSAIASCVPHDPRQLVALEVVWSPALETDRMSSAEMESVYPELLPTKSMSPLGRVSCGYCNAIYAGELQACPGCGAPRSAGRRPPGPPVYP